MFFLSVGEELTLLSLHGKVQSRSFKATSDDTRGLFAGNFRPLSPLKFPFPLSDIILLVHSDLLWVEYRWKRPVYYLFHPTQGLHDVFGVEMLRTYMLVAVGWNSLSARRQKVLHLFRSFFLLGREKKLRYGRVLELFLYTEMAQYLKFICFAFKISASVVFLFPWTSSWCSKIVTRLSRTNNSKLGY